MVKLLAASVATFGYSFAVAWTMPPAPPERVPTYLLEVITDDGNVYIAGSGSSCATAWQGAEIPGDWLEIRCQISL